MHSPKILIFGRRGQVGWELCHKLSCLGQLSAVGSSDADFAKPGSIRSVLQATRPDVIVNAVAYTAVDKAETESDRAMSINADAPRVLAEEARRMGSLLVHYSTDYVFDGGKQGGGWVETDAPGPLNVYGRSKLAGDEAIQASGCDHLIFRTSWVYGARGHNFFLTMLRLARERNELRIVDDQIGSPTTSECIAQATAHVLAQVLAPGGGIGGRSGIYNLACEGETSWHGFAKALLTGAHDRLGVPVPRLIPIKTDEYPQLARRPANSRLSCRRIEETFGVRMPHWEQALSLILEAVAEREPIVDAKA